MNKYFDQTKNVKYLQEIFAQRMLDFGFKFRSRIIINEIIQYDGGLDMAVASQQ